MHNKMQTALVFCLALLVTINRTEAQGKCQTPNRLNGNCISIRRCPPLLSILSGALTNANRDFLRQSQCGFDGQSPLVCCPLESSLTAADLPVPGVCGTQSRDRIVGGENTSITEYPWMALLEFARSGTRAGFNCGGALINENYVITAAHCITGALVVKNHFSVVSVRLGEHNLLTDRDCEDGECADPVIDIPIAERIIHESYDPNSRAQANDIALVRLARPVRFTDWIKPICLPTALNLRFKSFDNQPLIVAGFGKTENESRSDVKKKLEVNGYNLNHCNEIYRKLNIRLDATQLCAGGERGKDSCNGDSGGPLISEDTSNPRNPFYYLAGIVSFGPILCGTPGWPGVYTRISDHTDWILSHMRH